MLVEVGGGGEKKDKGKIRPEMGLLPPSNQISTAPSSKENNHLFSDKCFRVSLPLLTLTMSSSLLETFDVCSVLLLFVYTSYTSAGLRRSVGGRDGHF